MGQPRPLFVDVNFLHINFTETIFGSCFSMMQTRIVRVEGEHGDHHHAPIISNA